MGDKDKLMRKRDEVGSENMIATNETECCDEGFSHKARDVARSE